MRTIILGCITVFVGAKPFWSIRNCLLVKKFHASGLYWKFVIVLTLFSQWILSAERWIQPIHTSPVFLRSIYYLIINSGPPMQPFLNKPQSSICCYYIHECNIKLSLWTDMNCDCIFWLKLATIWSISRIFQVSNTLNMTQSTHQIHLITPYHLTLLKTKRRLLYLKTQFVSRSYKNQSVYAVSGTSRCLFSDK